MNKELYTICHPVSKGLKLPRRVSKGLKLPPQIKAEHMLFIFVYQWVAHTDL